MKTPTWVIKLNRFNINAILTQKFSLLRQEIHFRYPAHLSGSVRQRSTDPLSGRNLFRHRSAEFGLVKSGNGSEFRRWLRAVLLQSKFRILYYHFCFYLKKLFLRLDGPGRAEPPTGSAALSDLHGQRHIGRVLSVRPCRCLPLVRSPLLCVSRLPGFGHSHSAHLFAHFLFSGTRQGGGG